MSPVFPETLVEALIVGALALVSLSVVSLLGLLLHDYRKGKLW